MKNTRFRDYLRLQGSKPRERWVNSLPIPFKLHTGIRVRVLRHYEPTYWIAPRAGWRQTVVQGWR